MAQTTHTVLVVAPSSFRFNEEAFASNPLQVRSGLSESEIQERALYEFEGYVKLLRSSGIIVVAFRNEPSLQVPDSIFPNNWFSTHEDHTVILYPMCCANRRLERSGGALQLLKEAFDIYQIRDMSLMEPQGFFLEGTGSLVLDRTHRKAFACVSARTRPEALAFWSKQMDYEVISFEARTSDSQAMYHTNVMMCIGETFAILGASLIRNNEERRAVEEVLTKCGKEIISILEEQVYKFAGNALQVKNTAGETILVMSNTGWKSLSKEQQEKLRSHNCHVITPMIPIIEKIGGGSARCMLAEIFLRAKKP